MNIQGVFLALQQGKNVQRIFKSRRKEVWFLKTDRKRNFLFKRTINSITGGAVESPAAFDWDDIQATDYEVI